MGTMDNDKKLFDLFKKYDLSIEDIDIILSICETIYSHDEFQRRMTDEFLHHDKVTLGMHILEDTIVTYILYKKHKFTSDFDLSIALKIAMMHDFYELPWQNNEEANVDRFFNMHGFRHPIEAVKNANTCYPEYFENSCDSKKLIDGIVHHMYPFPVRSFNLNEDNELELKNFGLIKNMSLYNINLLKESSNRNKIGLVSFSKSEYMDGFLVSIADKIVSSLNFKGSNINGLIALLGAHNKNLDNYDSYKRNLK